MAPKKRSGRLSSERRHDWISFAYQIKMPAGMDLAEALTALRDYVAGEIQYREAGDIELRRPLPKKLQVTWQWRNAPDKPMLSDSVTAVVNESRTGYLKLMLRRIERDLARLPREEVRVAEEAARKREEERRRRSEAARAGWRRRKRMEELRKRARAARKAAETRKRKAAARKKKRRKK
jgi:hypothetical protein